MNEKTSKFYKLLKGVEQELYPCCRSFSNLSFIVQLLNIKFLFGLSTKEIDVILSLLTKTFPQENKVLNHTLRLEKILVSLDMITPK